VTVIRSAALRGFRATVLELVRDPDRLAQIAGLPPGSLGSDEMLVPLRSGEAFLRYTAVELGCPEIGLRIAARQDMSMPAKPGLSQVWCAGVGLMVSCGETCCAGEVVERGLVCVGGCP
jgi:Arabinose-binding domain of AraC transcription regulator, N-term